VQVVPHAQPGDRGQRPLLGLTSGYIQRAHDEMPKQGEKAPWYLRQSYLLDLFSTVFGRVTDPSLAFSRLGRLREQRFAARPSMREAHRAYAG
jgi:hypothetical protein